MTAFGLGLVLAGFLYLFVMPLLHSFRLLGPLIFALCFVASFFYQPAQGMMRTGVIMPWFALCGGKRGLGHFPFQRHARRRFAARGAVDL